ncbi:MAG: exosortase K [Desulfobacteraceae bacterium]
MTSGSVKNGGRHIRTPRILATAVAVLIMLAFKRHYSLATAGQLDWILAPTATLLAWLTPAQPVYESGVGYVDFARGIIVAPACAGVNFMIMTFGLGALCGLVNIRRTGPMWAWLPLSLAGAFGYTIIINTVRIFLSMMLYVDFLCCLLLLHSPSLAVLVLLASHPILFQLNQCPLKQIL